MSNSASTPPLPWAPPVSVISDDPIEHQHRRQRQLGIAGSEQLTATAGEEIFVAEIGSAALTFPSEILEPARGTPARLSTPAS